MFKRLLMLACLLAAANAFSSPPVAALVTALKGDVRAGAQRLVLLDPLQQGAELVLGEQATAVIFCPATASQFSLSGPGRFRVAAAQVLPESPGASVTVKRLDAAFTRVTSTHKEQAGVVVRGDDAARRLERVAPSQPLLAWQPRPRQGAWQVRVRGAGGAIVFEAAATENRLPLPHAVLEPGQAYERELRWRDRNGKWQTDIESFETISAGEDREVARLQPAAGASTSEQVLYAAYLRSLGVHSLADDLLRNLERPAP